LHDKELKTNRSGVEMEFSKISKSPLVTENYKQIVLALKWSFEKSPNLYSIVEIKNTSFLRGTGVLKNLQICSWEQKSKNKSFWR
jgi:hypothetical protein